jgi:HK97 family phage major capsid protein
MTRPPHHEELGLIPQLTPDTTEYVVATSKLGGSILISRESLDDTDFPVSQQTEQILRDTFSAKLDRDFIDGAGPHPTPTGILAVAAEVTGAD